MERQCCEWKDVECAFRNKIVRGHIANNKHLDLDSFFIHAKVIFHDRIQSVLQRKEMIKVFTILNCKMVKIIDGEEEFKTVNFHALARPITRLSNINEYFDEHVKDFMTAEFEKFQENGSGWALVSITHLDVYMSSFESLRGSSYVKLPSEILNKKACINVQNLNDEECFKWAILSALHPQPPESSSDMKTMFGSRVFQG